MFEQSRLDAAASQDGATVRFGHPENIAEQFVTFADMDAGNAVIIPVQSVYICAMSVTRDVFKLFVF